MDGAAKTRRMRAAHRRGLATLSALAVLALAAGLVASRASATPHVPTRVLGFYTDWDPASYTTLAAHYRDISVLSPGWLMFAADSSLVHDDVSQEVRVHAFVADKHPGFKLEPLVADWDPGPLAGALAATTKRTSLAASITAEAQANGWQGVNIDFEGLPDTSRGDLTAFMQALYADARPLGLEVSEDVGVEDPVFDSAALARRTDFLVPMFYDEHWSTGSPGPIAGQQWFTHALNALLKVVPASKVVVGIGNYGYDWKRGAAEASGIDYPGALALAHAKRRTIALDSASLNPRFFYGAHSVWLLDAITAFNEVSAASKYGVAGYAVWKLGGEDPTLWRVLHRRDSLTATVARSLATKKRSVTYSGKRRLIVAETVRP